MRMNKLFIYHYALLFILKRIQKFALIKQNAYYVYTFPIFPSPFAEFMDTLPLPTYMYVQM